MALHLAAHTLGDSHNDADGKPAILGVQYDSAGASDMFATATSRGWAVYRTQPLDLLSVRDFHTGSTSTSGSLRFVLPLERTNILFLVGGPPSPLYPPNKVVLWDDERSRAVAELEFAEEVRGLAARRDRLVVVLRRRVVVFVLGGSGKRTGVSRGRTVDLWREGTYETTSNPKGLVALATAQSSTLLAFPGRQPGQVQLVHLPPLDKGMPPLPPPPSHDPTRAPYPGVAIILAHASPLSALAVNPSGTVLATASSTGTLIRVWDPSAPSPRLVKELRRGTDSAQIFGIALRQDGQALCVSSDKGTVHVWDLTTTKREKKRASSISGQDEDSPRQKQFEMLKPYLPKYFSSEWSHSQFRLPPPAPLPSSSSRLPFSLATSAEPGTPPPPTVEDDVCICGWIQVQKPAPVPSTQINLRQNAPLAPDSSTLSRHRRQTPHSASSSAKGKQRERERESGTRTPRPRHAAAAEQLPRVPPDMITEHQIVALTRSGGWFRISLDVDGDSAGGGGGVVGLSKEATRECRLEEYRRFDSLDGW